MIVSLGPGAGVGAGWTVGDARVGESDGSKVVGTAVVGGSVVGTAAFDWGVIVGAVILLVGDGVAGGANVGETVGTGVVPLGAVVFVIFPGIVIFPSKEILGDVTLRGSGVVMLADVTLRGRGIVRFPVAESVVFVQVEFVLFPWNSGVVFVIVVFVVAVVVGEVALVATGASTTRATCRRPAIPRQSNPRDARRSLTTPSRLVQLFVVEEGLPQDVVDAVMQPHRQ